MNENESQQYTTLEEQLENLKKEQDEAERIYRGRMNIGLLSKDPESIKQLAQTILERKSKIDELESKIEQAKEFQEQDGQQEYEQEDNERQNNEEKSIVVYKEKNPILRWMKKIINKLEEKMQELDTRSKRDPMDWYKRMFEKEAEDIKKRQYDEYQQMANMNNTEIEEKTAHQIFADEVSNNGEYHTYRKKAENSRQQNKIEFGTIQHEANQNQEENLK